MREVKWRRLTPWLPWFCRSIWNETTRRFENREERWRFLCSEWWRWRGFIGETKVVKEKIWRHVAIEWKMKGLDSVEFLKSYKMKYILFIFYLLIQLIISSEYSNYRRWSSEFWTAKCQIYYIAFSRKFLLKISFYKFKGESGLILFWRWHVSRAYSQSYL